MIEALDVSSRRQETSLTIVFSATPSEFVINILLNTGSSFRPITEIQIDVS